MCKSIVSIVLLAGLISCSTNSKRATDTDATQSVCDTVLTAIAPSVDIAVDSALIADVYAKFVFAIDSAGDNNPEYYFTGNALKQLQDDYEFDCEDAPCYAFYALRTSEQDSKPGSDETSLICSVVPDGEGWYTVSYSDMGWPGKTRVKVADGKIDAYERLEP